MIGQYHLGTAPQGSAYFDLPNGEWKHIVCLKNGNILRTYMDAVLQDELVAGSSVINYVNPYLSIARWYSGGRYFHGSIDDVRMYNRGLNDIEVMLLYNEENPIPDSPTNVMISENSGIITITWNAVNGATNYKVYSDPTPNGDFSVLVTTVSIPECSIPTTEEKLFFQIKAIK